jgi:hypothetical protein
VAGRTGVSSGAALAPPPPGSVAACRKIMLAVGRFTEEEKGTTAVACAWGTWWGGGLTVEATGAGGAGASPAVGVPWRDPAVGVVPKLWEPRRGDPEDDVAGRRRTPGLTAPGLGTRPEGLDVARVGPGLGPGPGGVPGLLAGTGGLATTALPGATKGDEGSPAAAPASGCTLPRRTTSDSTAAVTVSMIDPAASAT